LQVITVRLATLADTAAITDIHRSHIPRWERLTADGTPVEVPYESLMLYERWQHGGPWLSIETCAVHLNRLLARSGFPLVAEVDGRVLGVAEVYESFEPPPFGHHLELSVIMTHAEHANQGVGSALMGYIIDMARLMRCERLTVSDAETPAFYEKHGFRHAYTGRGVRILPQAGRVFYQATDLTDGNPLQIKGWYMPLGRFRSSRQEWDRLFPQDWAAGIPELLSIATAHVKMTVTGSQNAILFAREADEIDAAPGDVHLACWTARPLTNQLLTAIRDWAHRSGYRRLLSYAMESDLALLGPDGEVTDYSQSCYELIL
jgi:GNAT superfamily N-acetyltransferase